tara:strand:+ start:36 stop:500 length:465 start_codon:yes stop_codon:yes gene_type:complete
MKNKIIKYFIFFFFLISCGYNPILTQTELPFKIDKIELEGNNKINSIISKKLTSLENNNNELKKSFNIFLNTNLSKVTISKDSKGDPLIFEIKIESDLKIINEKENINLEKNITKKISYNNLTDKFELKRYEETLIQNLSINIGDRIISILSNL